MEYKNGKERLSALETVIYQKRAVSQLVIEDNTIYEIDLDCQYRKNTKKESCKSCNEKKGVQ